MKTVLPHRRPARTLGAALAAATLTAPFLIGAGGLGEHIFVGIDLMRSDKLLAGAIPTILLALCADYLCGLLGLLMIPKGLRLQRDG